MSSFASKLRHSCNACATSKIKCSKERPSCSRCESRGVTCHYSFTKRPGRKPENGNRPSNETITVSSTPRSHDTGTDNDLDSNHSGNEDLPPSQTSHPSLGDLFWSESPTPSSMTPSNTPGTNNNPNANGYFAISHATRPSVVSSPILEHTPGQADSDVFFMLGDINSFPEFDGFDPKLDKFLESAIESAIESSFALPGQDGNGNTTLTPTQNDIASLLIPASSTHGHMGPSEAPSAADTGSVSSSSLSSSASALSSSIFTWSGPPFPASSALSSLSASSSSSRLFQFPFPGVTDSSSACHLAQTLDILKTLSSVQSSQPNPYGGPESPHDIDAFTKVVLGENQQSIDAVGAILASSSCGDDSFLLAVLSMIVLKILERYGAAAQVQPIDMEPEWGPRFANGMISHSTGQDHRRTLSAPHSGTMRQENGRQIVAAKLVLGELHRVQRLVNELSLEFRRHREGDGDQIMTDGEKITRPLVTTSTLAQLETDMRKSLNALSTEIIDRLRQR